MAGRFVLAGLWHIASVAPCAAEVADKIATTQSNLLWLAVVVLGCMLLGYVRDWLPLLLAPLTWLLAAATVILPNESDIELSIRREMGDCYFAEQYVFALLFALAPLLCWLVARRLTAARRK